MFDLEMIQKDALMGCALHEKMIRNKLNQFSPFSGENIHSPTFVSPARTMSSSEMEQAASGAANNLMVPYVKLQRSTIIDNMAESYAQKQNNISIPLPTIFKRKRSNWMQTKCVD